jgi:hypothetical protein
MRKSTRLRLEIFTPNPLVKAGWFLGVSASSVNHYLFQRLALIAKVPARLKQVTLAIANSGL